MKERLERVSNSFKTGVIIWITAYMLLYLVGYYTNELQLYNSEIMKLTNAGNFFAQVMIAGITYVILEVVLIYFVNKVITFSEENKIKNSVKCFILSFVIVAILCVILYFVKEEEIINKNIIKLMMCIIGVKTILFSINQLINTRVYNKKLEEKKNKS